ncbi:hypothetical protein GVY41_14100 [Frigidibacter albus]|uniref:YHYH domain-containing protein n=1 Tax=Frigidibacter albus TaxID=1465486 RepID=A0A6L8VJH1_9RHOB|nr:hypothetical protein [Frigidibacter albus]MZQ90373.1 hypothetical protein [Frigidibacter albus]NBE32129.1 hypothetical protein [Frigidibacter albus]GGH59026.1 hypothetical protein GCM10011341_29930 [Frigidibacter albus]
MTHSTRVLLAGLWIAVGATPAFAVPMTSLGAPTVEHGGGCRKSSPPGQCCHMQNSTGTVHCH